MSSHLQSNRQNLIPFASNAEMDYLNGGSEHGKPVNVVTLNFPADDPRCSKDKLIPILDEKDAALNGTVSLESQMRAAAMQYRNVGFQFTFGLGTGTDPLLYHRNDYFLELLRKVRVDWQREIFFLTRAFTGIQDQYFSRFLHSPENKPTKLDQFVVLASKIDIALPTPGFVAKYQESLGYPVEALMLNIQTLCMSCVGNQTKLSLIAAVVDDRDIEWTKRFGDESGLHSAIQVGRLQRDGKDQEKLVNAAAVNGWRVCK